MELHGRRYDTGEPVTVQIEGAHITAVLPAWPQADVSSWPTIAPAFFDLQINGYGGVWFSKEGLTAAEVKTTLAAHFQYGISRLCPTLITNSHAALLSGFTAIREACEQDDWANQMIPGCHLEGPYITTEDGPRGAHSLQHIRPADWDEFQQYQQASGNRIRLVTLAAEADGAIPFIEQAVANNVVISIGHTAATPQQITAAVDAGARLSTHLGNAAHGMIRRHPNYIWEQLGDPRLMASIITDGHHLPASVVRSIIAAKSPLRTIITCDASGLAGCPPGRYTVEETDVEILEDGRIVIAGQDQLLAGSSLATDSCVTAAMEMADINLKQACDMAGRNPANLLGFEEIALKRNSRADLLLFHYAGAGHPLEIVATLGAGVVRYGDVPELATV